MKTWLVITLLIPIAVSSVQLKIPTEDYRIVDDLVCLEGFGHTLSGFSLPVRVFPIIVPPTLEIHDIQIKGLARPIKEFSPIFTRYSIQQEPLEPLRTDTSLIRDVGLVLASMKLNDNVIYPVIMYPFYFNEIGELVHTPYINISIDLDIDYPPFLPKPFDEKESDKNLCVLTTPSIEKVLGSFISRKESMGYTVSLIIESTPMAPYQIRKLIKEKRSEWAFSHLLIIGDYQSIPGFRYGDIYTDFFYGEITSDTTSPFEPFAEVAVGRIPYSEPTKVERYLSRSISFQIRDYETDILFNLDEDMVYPQFMKEIDSLLRTYNVDYDEPKGKYSFYINHTLNTELEAPIEDAIVISTAANSAYPIMDKYRDKVAGLLAPTSYSYFSPQRPGGTTTYLYKILKNFLLKNMSIGDAVRLAGIDYWMEYPDSFTEKNILSFNFWGDPTNTFKIIRTEDVGIIELPNIPFRSEPGLDLLPSVVIKNFGDRRAYNGKVILEMTKDGELLYSESIDVLDIEPKVEREIEFPRVILPAGRLKLRASSIFPSDINESNDVIEKMIVSSSDLPVVIATDTLYAKLFLDYLSENAFFSKDTSQLGFVDNVFLLNPLQVEGKNIYIEGFSPERDYNGIIQGLGRFAGYSSYYSGPIASIVPGWLNFDSLSIAMTDAEGNPVAYFGDSRFVFLGRALFLKQPALFLDLIKSIFYMTGNVVTDTIISLYECNPNLTKGETAILFDVPYDDANISLCIYDITGHLIRTMVQGRLSKGIYSYIFDGLDSAGREIVSGTYFVILSIDSRTYTQKFIKLR